LSQLTLVTKDIPYTRPFRCQSKSSRNNPVLLTLGPVTKPLSLYSHVTAFYSYLIGAVSRPRRQRHSDVKNKQGTMCVCAYCRLPSGLSTRAFFSPTERGHQVYKEDLESRSSSWWCLRRRGRPDDLNFKSEAFALRLIIKLMQ
jgi:hypothetical protein